MNVNRKEKIIKSASNIQYSGVTRAQFKGGTMGAPLFLGGHVNICILQPQMGTYFF